MKHSIKVGTVFDGIKVTIEVKKESALHDWKTLSVLCVFLTALIGVAYAYATGDKAIFDKTVDAVVNVATKTKPPEKDNGKEK